MRARLLIASLVGGLLCTLLDQVHVHTGTLSYTHGLVWGQAWWVWPEFTATAMVNLAGYPVGAWLTRDRADLAPRRDRWGTRELVAATVWFAGVYALSGVLNTHPRALTALFLGTFLARALADGSRGLWLNAVVLAAAGTTAESALCHLGWFQYDVPGAFGLLPVPVWLPGIYLHAAFVVRAAVRRGLAG